MSRVEVKGVARTKAYFKGIQRRAMNFSAQLRWARDEIKKANRQNFATQGMTSGKAWNALDLEYQSWKIQNYGPLPTMIREGDLYRELTTLSGRANHIGLKSAQFGTDLDGVQLIWPHQFDSGLGQWNHPESRAVTGWR